MTATWRTVRLAELLNDNVAGPVPTPREELVRLAGVRLHGGGVYEARVVPGAEIKTKTLTPVQPGALIYNRMWATRGTFAVVPDSAAGMYVTNEYPQFRIDKEAVEPRYLELLTQLPAFLDQVDAAAVGSTDRRRLHPDALLDMEVDLPPLDEQRRIVEAVAAAEQAVAAHERYASAAFTALRAAREALLFTEGDWEDLPPGWELRRLDEVADIRAGITKGRKVQRPLTEVPFIRAANVQDGFLDLSEVKTLAVTAAERERFRVQADDILMIEGGNAEHVGRGWLWEGQEEAVCQNHVFRVRVTTGAVIPRFLAYAIGASPARAYCYDAAKKTTNLASISKSQISELAVPVPPVSVQADVVRKLDALRRVGVAELRHARRLTRFRAALIEELVSGARPAPAVGVLR
ncbi:restriction endonuclease subunit S [Thermoleophilum album]|uniref:Type I restriction enzyme, S subunit n=1 Tax=Thermoleophilum album TaxID=29539 RepID=A0A1H6G0P4_THEAL|nr:restriction endonuclease subunit S [Thermoleophilum album]SEH15475.1 type I restriction enzyme, S subunit [Thermoleophilum album]